MNILGFGDGFYNDPWFWQFPMATLEISMAAFLTVALPWTIVAWIDPISLRKYEMRYLKAKKEGLTAADIAQQERGR
ncbi:hypothetical protein ACNQ6O_05360 [Marinobacter sp. SBS5]|uniref:hypothetical protein n=1 Tax=Marinobacter sp. SBS5 TaxID=3401754 RepID=UPI003AADB9A6